MRNYKTSITFCGDLQPFTIQGWGNDPSDPYWIETDIYYGADWGSFFGTYEIRYIAFSAVENEIYFIYIDPAIWWDLELYDDPNFTILLGTPYSVSLGQVFREYLFFSPNRTGTYYLKLYQTTSITDLSLAVLTAKPYSLNTSKIVTIGEQYQPIQVFQIDVDEGNFSVTHDTLYATITRGWNYVVLEDAYNKFPLDCVFTLETGSYGILIEESCEFMLTSYPPTNGTSQSELPDTPPDNATDPVGSTSFLDDVSPIFGIGVLIGILVVYKVKKSN